MVPFRDGILGACMRKLLVALLVAGAGLSGCTGDDPVSADIHYREIRIDAFTHFWEARRLAADAIEADTLWRGNDGVYLKATARVKPSKLPARKIDSVGEGPEWFYASKAVPEGGFTCQQEYDETIEYAAADSADLVEVQREVEDLQERSVTGYKFVKAARGVVRRFPCEYVPGKGFRLLTYMGSGTYVIRY